MNQTNSKDPPWSTIFTTQAMQLEPSEPTDVITIEEDEEDISEHMNLRLRSGLRQRLPATATTIPNRREGLRQRRRMSYRELEQYALYGMGYDADLDLVAICSVNDNVLSSLLYDSSTMKPFMKLNPVKLSIPKNFHSLSCSQIAVHLHEWFLAVRLHLYDEERVGSDTVELYTVNLLAEDLESIL